MVPDSSSAVCLGSLGSQGRLLGLFAVFKGSLFRHSGHFKVSWGNLGAFGFRFLMVFIRFSEASRHPNRAGSPDATSVHVSAICLHSNLFENVNDILTILMIFLFVVAVAWVFRIPGASSGPLGGPWGFP